jgi:plastocyanin
MKRLTPVIGVLALILPATAGDVSGRALITRQLTKKTISSVVYDLRGGVSIAAPPSQHPLNEFDRMVVILEGATASPRPPVTAVIDQRNSRFDPDLVVIPVGSTVEFPNSDPIFHNVFSLSRAQSFDLGFYPRGQVRTVKFNRAGIVQVYCHIHANMYASIVVTAGRWYSRPERDGSFFWNDVPAGRYHLKAWHKVAGLHGMDLVVPEKGTAEVTISIPVDLEPHP